MVDKGRDLHEETCELVSSLEQSDMGKTRIEDEFGETDKVKESWEHKHTKKRRPKLKL